MEKTHDDNISIFRLSSLSERMPAGILNTTPVNAETAATNPIPEGSAPRWAANRGSTGLFDIVDEYGKKPCYAEQQEWTESHLLTSPCISL